MTTDNQNSPVAPQGEYPSLPEAAVWSVAGKDGMPTLGKGWMFSPVQQGNATLPLFTADQLRAYFDLGRQAAPALEAPSAYNSAGPIKRYMLDCNIDGMDQFREFILATDHDTLVHDVLANADPAGTVQENGLLRDQVRQLDAMVGRMKREAVAPQAPAAPVLVGDGQADAYLADPGRLETLARSHPAGLVRALARAALAAAPQAPAALEELRKIAAIAACWGCDHPDAPGDTETVRRIKWAARQLRAAAQAPAAPAVDAFTHAELLEIKRAVEEFADCNETDVDYALLLRAAQAGYLECTQFHVLNQSALDLDTVAAAQAKEGGA